MKGHQDIAMLKQSILRLVAQATSRPSGVALRMARPARHWFDRVGVRRHKAFDQAKKNDHKPKFLGLDSPCDKASGGH